MTYLREESEWNEDLWRAFADPHTLLLRLAGRVPDETMVSLRQHLGAGELPQLVGEIEAVAIGYQAQLPIDGLQMLPRGLYEPGSWMPPEHGLVLRPDGLPLPDYTFTQFPQQAMALAGPHLLDLVELSGGQVETFSADVAYQLFGGDFSDPIAHLLKPGDGVIGLWSVWRSGPEGQAPKLMHVAELDPRARAWDFTSHFQRSRAQDGAESPQIEAYWSGGELPEYQRRAQASGVLVWARDKAPVTLERTAPQRPGVPVGDTGYLTDGRYTWQAEGAETAGGQVPKVDGVQLFRARLALRRAGVAS
jgi:hypothetical protein